VSRTVRLRPIVRLMQRTTKSGRADRESAADHVPMRLPSDRAFVLHLDARARPPQFTVGRVEHIASGRVGHFGSLDGLIAFLAGVLAAR